MSRIKMLHIEIDGHMHGGPPHKPWVARIVGTSPRYGLDRQFVEAMRDYRHHRRAWSGNVYGVVATFPLRSGLHEVCRARGRSSRRHVAREFWVVDDGKMRRLEPIDALALVEAHAEEVVIHEVPDHTDPTRWIARVTGLGTPERAGWVVVGSQRLYRLRRAGLYEIVDGESKRFVRVDRTVSTLSEKEALACLRQ